MDADTSKFEKYTWHGDPIITLNREESLYVICSLTDLVHQGAALLEAQEEYREARKDAAMNEGDDRWILLKNCQEMEKGYRMRLEQIGVVSSKSQSKS